MKPVGPVVNNKQTSCDDYASSCVMWDGPNISMECLGVQIYQGESINSILYNSLKNLCNILERIDMDSVNVECIGNIINTDRSINDVFNIIIDKMCLESDKINALESKYNEVLYADLPYCLQEISDPLIVTKLKLPEYYQKLALQICLYLTDIIALQTAVAPSSYIQTQLALLNTEITALCGATTALVTPTCTNDPVANPGANPVKVELAYDWLEAAFCTFKNFTGTPTELAAAVARDCPNLGNLPRLTNTGNMSDIPGWIDTPYSVADSMTNLWLTICDLRSAINNLQLGCCADSPCLSFNIGYTLVFNPNSLTVVFSTSSEIKSLDRTNSYAGGILPAWLVTDFPVVDNVTITLNDGSGDVVYNTGQTIMSLMTSGSYVLTYPVDYDPSAPIKTINIKFDYKWNNPVHAGDTDCATCECCCTFNLTNGIY